MNPNINQISNSFKWGFAQQLLIQIINFGVTIILARALLPEDFGIIALFSVFISIASLIVDGGFTISLIRKINVTEKEYSTIFWYNLLASIFVYILLFSSSYYIAEFYNLADLEVIIKVYSFSIVFSALICIQKVKLTKKLAFKKLFYINFPASVLSGFVGVVLSHYELGVWSLVIMYLTNSILTTLAYFVNDRYIPLFYFNYRIFKEHFQFAYKITLSNLIDTLFINAYPLVIGKYYSHTEVGYYNRADSLKQLPVRNITEVLNKVSFPLFAKIQEDNDKLKSIYIIFTKIVILVITPILGLMILGSKEIIIILFTEKWIGMAPILSIVCISSILNPLQGFNLNILQIKNKANLYLRIEFIKKFFEILIIFFTIRFSIEILLWGQLLYCIIAFVINSYYTGGLIGYSTVQQIKDIYPIILTNFLIFLLLSIIDFDFDNYYLLLLFKLTVYLSIYGTFITIFYKKEVINMKSYLKNENL